MTGLFDGYPKTLLARFKKFHRNNPQVYLEFERLAYQMKATGRKRYGARTIAEVMRWHYDLNTIGDVFEINDNYIPIYARLLIYRHPEFKDFFELRVIRSRDVQSNEERRRRAALDLGL
jgi:hypothetical protein